MDVMPTSAKPKRKTLVLTGASRGIGHATVMRFAASGWRVISCSRHPFPENCPWEMGRDDHLQVDLADAADTARAVVELKARLESDGSQLHALVNNAGISPKSDGGGRLNSVDTEIDAWRHVFQVNFFAPIMLTRGLMDELARAGSRRQHHVHRWKPRASVRRLGICHVEGGAGGADARDGRRPRPARHSRQRHLAG
jgi:NAD(P)-dependent dehydrogenase (short-subunit alcohol dehydrogenase family)